MRPLLVPVAVEAYIANRENPREQELVRVQPDYTLLAGRTRLGAELDPLPFATEAPLPAGVHLHFILPDAFTHAVQTQQAVEYPRVPDRWLVTRLWEQDGFHVRSWLVESDYCGLDNSSSITIPFLTDPQTPYRRLGRAYPWGEAPQATGEWLSATQPLTAVGPGEASFAAYYPNCRSVFGFHDALEDLPAGRLTYFVQGYFSVPEQDPLHGLDKDGYQTYLEACEWSAPDVQEVPERLVCQGLVYEVDWRGPQAEYPSGIPSGAVDCAVGNSSAEALSALISRQWSQRGGEAKELERFLTLMQYELLNTLDGIDGIPEAEDLCHAAAFEPVRQGRAWELRAAAMEERTPPPVSAGLGAQLAALNHAQEAADTLARQRSRLQEDLFAAWNVYCSLADTPAPPWVQPKPSKEEAAAEVRRLCQALDDWEETARQCAAGVETARAAMEKALENQPQFVLSETEAAAFYRPREPVVLLAGEGIRRPYAYGQDGRFTTDGTLACRLETIQGLTGGGVSLSSREINAFCPSDPTLPPPFSDLLCEALCLTPAFAASIAASVGMNEAEPVGPAPSPLAVSGWSQPWITLFLEWKLSVTPTRANADPDTSMSGWEFDGIDYTFGKLPTAAPLFYTGRTVLTPHSTQLLAEVLERNLQRYREDPERYDQLQQMLEQIKCLAVVSQQCGGFHTQLLSQRQALQAPVLAVRGDEELAAAAAKRLADAEKLCAPFPAAGFLPVRAGFVQVDQINAVSSFGHRQTLTSRLQQPVFSEQLDGRGMLPPRLVQGARLEFRWLDAGLGLRAGLGGDMTPVCGFLFPDLLNHQLSAYEADGEYRGALRLAYRAGKAGSRWTSAPGLPSKLEDIPFASVHLKQFLTQLDMLGRGEDPQPALDALLRMTGARLDASCVPDAGEDLACLWGRPLALVRAEAALRLAGPPAVSRDLKDFGAGNTKHFDELRYPLYIGDIARSLDGAIGFFPDGAQAYAAMHCVWNAPRFPLDTSYLRYDEPISLSALDETPARFTLLMEAGSQVSLRTGILPSMRVSVQAEHLQNALAKLYPSFELFPVLGGADGPELPLPALKEAHWAWAVPGGQEPPQPVAAPVAVFSEEGYVLTDGRLLQLPGQAEDECR